VKFVFLRGNYALVEQQLRRRRAHFMNPALSQSQFADLEEPGSDEDVLTIELGRTPEELVEEIKTKLGPGLKRSVRRVRRSRPTKR
jgi:gluconokinase